LKFKERGCRKAAALFLCPKIVIEKFFGDRARRTPRMPEFLTAIPAMNAR